MSFAYWLIMVPLGLFLCYMAYRDTTRNRRDYRHAEFWRRCTEKQAKRAIAEINRDPNTNIKNYYLMTEFFDSAKTTPIIEACKANRPEIVELLIGCGCDPFKQELMREADYKEPAIYHCAADYSYLDDPKAARLNPQKERLRSAINEYRECIRHH